MSRRNEGVISVEVDGKPYSGAYSIEGSVLTVRSANGSESTQLGRMETEVLAKQLLRELVRKGKG